MTRTVCGVCGWDVCRCDIMSGNVISWAGNVTRLTPGPSAEELMVLNRWLQDQNAVLRWQNDALQAENERLREALKAETARCATICEEFAQRCRDAGWDSEAAILRDAAKTMRE